MTPLRPHAHDSALVAVPLDITGRDIAGVVVISLIILAMWLAFRNLQRLMNQKDD